MPNNNSEFQAKVREIAAFTGSEDIRECYGMSNSAKFVSNGFLCGVPNIDNLSDAANALCVFSQIGLGPQSELHTAILIRRNLVDLRARMKAMISDASGFFSDKNNNCALYLAADGKIYPCNKAKAGFELNAETLSRIGPGIEPDYLFCDLFGDERDGEAGPIEKLAALVGVEHFIRVEHSDLAVADWSDNEWCLGILIYNRHVLRNGITRPQAEFSRWLVNATRRSSGSWDRRIANIRFALAGAGLAGGGGTQEKVKKWQMFYEQEPGKVVLMASDALSSNDDGEAIREALGIPGSPIIGTFCAQQKIEFGELIGRDPIGFRTSRNVLDSFICALIAKPFLLLTGNSGTGKTKLAELLAFWLGGSEKGRSIIVPVGADWTDNRNVLGFVNFLRLSKTEGDLEGKPVYQSTRILDLLLLAAKEPANPFFLILDEMNLSHVERYFADFLSAMESRDGELLLHREGRKLPRKAGGPADVPETLRLPRNVFVIGTVNVDETTYMFSPKVLDRANVLEFRVNSNAPVSFLESGGKSIGEIPAAPDGYAAGFLELSYRARGLNGAAPLALVADPARPPEDAKESLIKCRDTIADLFAIMQKRHQEFAFRSMAEILRYLAVDYELTADEEEWAWAAAMDAQIIQKILPKLHGSKRKIGPLLASLATYCEKGDRAEAEKMLENDTAADGYAVTGEKVFKDPVFSESHRKLREMIQSVRREQFVSFIQ